MNKTKYTRASDNLDETISLESVSLSFDSSFELFFNRNHNFMLNTTLVAIEMLKENAHTTTYLTSVCVHVLKNYI